jgi:NOL1/NOP2/fmu family ribosome biogenesis protein
VLDICAAPGGKSTELAAKLKGSGIIISNDISNSRAKALLKNMELFGIGNMAVTSEPPNVLADRFTGYFDKILIDAPCSGEGMFRKSGSMITAWENNGVKLFSDIQRGILNEAVKMLKPGGTILYSTCTFSPDEDERSVEYMLSLDSQLELLDIQKFPGFDDGHPEWGNTSNQDLRRCARLWPHRLRGEGHFLAMARKAQSEEGICGTALYPFKKSKLPDYVAEFFSHISLDAGIEMERIEENNGRLFYIKRDMPDIKGLRTLRIGLFLGEMKKNRFEPSQSLAMYLKGCYYDNVCLFEADDKTVIKYLKGETVFTEQKNLKNGYVLVCVDGYPLGWAKHSGGTLKNKYLSGWRMM